jgi:hypothetical protein
MKKGIRQGDVLLMPVELLGETAPTETPQVIEQYTLAHGEQTGHHHTAYGEAPAKLWDSSKGKYLAYGSEMILKHQEHKEHRILPDTCYKILNETEFDPFEEEMRVVRD